MLTSPGKSSNQDPQSASRAIEQIDKSASSLKWSQGTCPLKEREERDKRKPLKQGQSATVNTDGKELKANKLVLWNQHLVNLLLYTGMT